MVQFSNRTGILSLWFSFSSLMIGSIYLEHILDLYKHPHNFGALDSATVKHRAFNPLCGDDLTMYLLTHDDTVTEVMWEGKGCAISMASASLVTDAIKNMKLTEVMALDKRTLLEMLGIEIGPVRLKCALLSLEAVHMATQKLL